MVIGRLAGHSSNKDSVLSHPSPESVSQPRNLVKWMLTYTENGVVTHG